MQYKHIMSLFFNTGGTFVPAGDPLCTHLVVDETVMESDMLSLNDYTTNNANRLRIVKQEVWNAP